MEFEFQVSNNASTDSQTPASPTALAIDQEDASNTEQRVQEVISTFVYLPMHRALVCKEHGYAIDAISGHLQRSHKDIKGKIKTAIVQHFVGYDIIQVDNIVLPEAGQVAIDCLDAAIVGYSCEHEIEQEGDSISDESETAVEPSVCGHISTNRKKIAEHCRKAHNWKSTAEDRQCWKEVYVQSFSKVNGHQRWFVVKTPDEAEREAASIRQSLPQAKQIQFDGIKEDFQKLKEQWQKEQDILSDKVEKCENTGWWNKTRWREHLKNCNLIYLSHASRLPEKEEEGLLRVAEVIEKMVERGVSGLSSMPEGLRRWLRSAEMHKPDVRPLARLQNPESQERYVGYWKRMICYCLRVWCTRNEATDSESSGDSSNNDDTGSDSDEANSVHDANTNTDPDDGRHDDDNADDNSDTDLQHD